MVAATSAPSQLVAVGWPMATPRLNYFRDLLWRNPDACRFAAIIFEQRLVPTLHEIPIFEFRDVESASWRQGKTFIELTINKQLLERCQQHLAKLGIRTRNPADFARDLVNGGSPVGVQASPFAEICLDDIRRLAARSMSGRYSRLADLQSIDLAGSLEAIWREFRWDSLFDWTSGDAPDSPLRHHVNEYYARGVRAFVVGRSRNEDLLDLVVHFGALHRSGDYRAWSLGPLPPTERGRLHRAVIGQRLSELPGEIIAPSLILADSLDDYIEIVNVSGALVEHAGAVVRLRRSLEDLIALIDRLDATGRDHKIALRMQSANPSWLFAHVFPVP